MFFHFFAEWVHVANVPDTDVSTQTISDLELCDGDSLRVKEILLGDDKGLMVYVI